MNEFDEFQNELDKIIELLSHATQDFVMDPTNPQTKKYIEQNIKYYFPDAKIIFIEEPQLCAQYLTNKKLITNN
jgi:hypothetical protein